MLPLVSLGSKTSLTIHRAEDEAEPPLTIDHLMLPL
jgi:hypothetical protein